jgi:hypothetical protein
LFEGGITTNCDNMGTCREVVVIFYIGVNPRSDEFVAPTPHSERGKPDCASRGGAAGRIALAGHSVGWFPPMPPGQSGIHKKGGQIT